MLTWAKAVMEAENSGQLGSFNGEANRNGFEASEQVLRHMAHIRSTKRPMIDISTDLENSYALGWFRHMHPSLWLGYTGSNFGLWGDSPFPTP